VEAGEGLRREVCAEKSPVVRVPALRVFAVQSGGEAVGLRPVSRCVYAHLPDDRPSNVVKVTQLTNGGSQTFAR
jgi:hypothetical protein